METLLQHFREIGERPALIAADGALTYAELAEAVLQRQAALRERGLVADDVLSIEDDFSAEAVALLLASAALGLVAVPLSPMPEEARQERCTTAQVGLRWQAGQWTPHVAKPDPHLLYQALRERGHAGLVLFSSGSTGAPKAMLHDLHLLIESYPLKKRPPLRLLAFLHFDHIGGIDTLLRGLASGVTLILCRDRSPEAVAALAAKERAQVLPASPTFLNLLLLSGALGRHDLSALEIIGYGAEPMPPGLLDRLKTALPGVAFQQKFGTSETNAIRIQSQGEGLAFRINDPAVDYRIVDGELWLRTPTRVLGYLNADSDRLTEDGWFRTGDLAEETPDGWLRILGRQSEVINVGGEKVLPAEVENCLLELPGVLDCTVYGKPNALTGQAVAVRVVAPEVDAQALKRSIRRHCRGKLATYKIPAYVEIVAEIPHSNRFKKQR